MSLKKNTIWNIFGTGAPLIVGFYSVPYLIRGIGNELFGVLTLIWGLIGYFSLFDFGLGRALTQRISVLRSESKHSLIPSNIKTGMIFTLYAGLFGGLLIALMAYPAAYRWLNVSPEIKDDVYKSLLVSAIGIPLATLTAGFRGVLEGFEDFQKANVLRAFLGLANFFLPVLVITLFGASLLYMVVSLVLARLIILIFHYRIVSNISVNKKYQSIFDKKSLIEMMRFGSWMTVSNIVSPIMVTADRFFISSFLGASVVAFYTVPYEALSRLLIIPSALSSALFPKFSYSIKISKYETKKIFVKSIYAIACLMFLICSIIAVSAQEWLSLWLSEKYGENSKWVAVFLCVGVFFNSLAQIPFALIQASGDTKTTAFLHIAELIFYIPILIMALKLFGINGAAVVWMIRAFVDFILLYFFSQIIMEKSCEK